MDEDDRVLPRLDDLVEVADRARLDGLRERPVDPDRLVALDEIAADEVAPGQVLVAGDRDEVRPASVRAMYSTKRRLAATRRPLRRMGSRAPYAAVKMATSSPIGR
jgi:hypothetical protein